MPPRTTVNLLMLEVEGMAGPIKIGILRFEHYHANFWTKALTRSDDAIYVGFWEPDDALADAAVEIHGVIRYADIDALIADCDAVAVCSATSGHLPLIEKAARAGKAILCEKPIAHTNEDCRKIAEVIKETGVTFMQSFPKRFDPINHEIRTVLDSNEIGALTMVRIRHGHNHGTLTPGFGEGWFADPSQSGGGTLIDEGVHAADYLRWTFGEPSKVCATISSDTLGLDVEDSAIAIFKWDNGLIGEVTTSWSFAAADTSVEVYGTKGTILLSGVDIASRPNREKDFLKIYRLKDGKGEWTHSQSVPAFKTGVFHEHVAWNFVSALREGRPMPVTLKDGWHAFAMIDAAYKSARSGQFEPIIYPNQ
jgi:predicted dehydrogenase